MSAIARKIRHDAVFRSRTRDDDDAELSEKLVASARRTGRLDLSSRGLSAVPSGVWTINELTEKQARELDVALDRDEGQGDRWWEREPLKSLNLSSNALAEIDPRIEFLADLEVLDLRDNLLSTLPAEIGGPSKLRELLASRNRIERLPPRAYDLVELRRLDLRSNVLKELDPAVGNLVMLEQMNLSCNNLTSLPVGLGYLVRLVSLDLSRNSLRELPPDVTSMRALKRLDAGFNALEILPPLGELRKMEELLLQTNRLEAFPDTEGCVALRELHLSDNRIGEINASCLESMGQLKVLTLADNKIEVIPDEIICLLNLEHLDVSCNRIHEIPARVAAMPNLQSFLVEGNDVRNVRRDIIRCGTARIVGHLRRCESAARGETEEGGCTSPETTPASHPDKFSMRRAKLLSLVGRNLCAIPDAVLEEASEALVTSVDLSRNCLRELPAKLSSIATLTDLKLRCNALSSLPEWLGERFQSLRYLDLSNNRLSSLPASLALLERLREVNVSRNRFTELPNCLGGAVGLEILLASDNQIRRVDVAILRALPRLATLDLSNNDIRCVPPELGNLRNLRNLMLCGNCFKQPRQATLTKGTEEILAYLRDRIPS